MVDNVRSRSGKSRSGDPGGIGVVAGGDIGGARVGAVEGSGRWESWIGEARGDERGMG